MKKVIILSNHHSYTYNFRKEIIQRLLDEKYKVYIVLPYGEDVDKLVAMGCEFINLPLDRRGMNPITDFKLLLEYYKVIKKIKPDIVLSYTIKPNLYGGIVCRLLRTPFIPNITGLGSAVENSGLLQSFSLFLYRIALKEASCVFFQNKENQEFFINKNIIKGNNKIIPGSGVNLEEYPLLDYPPDETINFLFLSRIMKEKGIDQYLDAAKYIKRKYPKTVFHVVGFCEEAYEGILKSLHDQGIIQFHGLQKDVKEFYQIAHCIVHPSYYPEGISNALLESSACGRPVITTDRSGCREIVENGVTGYIVKQKNTDDLVEKLECFMSIPYNNKVEMGKAARIKVQQEFNREIVKKLYMKEITEITG